MARVRLSNNVVAPAAIFGLALLFGGCRHAPDDATLAQTVQSQLAADSAIAGQPIQATVQGGVVTLSGSVQNDAQKTLAARDAAAVTGVKEVDNTLSVGSASASVTAPAPAPLPLEPAKIRETPKIVKENRDDFRRQPAPIERSAPPPAMQAQNNVQPPPPPPPQPQPVQQQAPAPPPPQPTFKEVTIATGSTLPVRITQTLDSASTQQGTTFSGVIASDILVDGLVALPAGTTVSGTVDAVQEAAHYKGSALLTVSLASVNRRGEHIAITTDPYTVTGKGRGANTAEKIGGGAAVGAILGGIFGGGKGAAIGAAAGGGAGGAANTVTRGQQVQIQSETVVRFHLATPMQIRVRTDGERNSSENGLQQHPTD